jgi:hypothetical protein
VAKTDHTALGRGSVNTLLNAGLMPELLEDKTMTDPFAAPAALAEPKHDRYGRYLLPDPQTGKEQAWTRVSTVARTLADEYGLTQWKLRMAAKGIALRPDLIAAAAAADVDADKKRLDEIAESAMERAGAGAGRQPGHRAAHLHPAPRPGRAAVQPRRAAAAGRRTWSRTPRCSGLPGWACTGSSGSSACRS